MVLADLLEKAGDGDFQRAVAAAVLQLLMESDVEGMIGAGAVASAPPGATAIATAPSTLGSARCNCASRTAGTASLLTQRWREPDSNHRSRSCERLFWALPIGDGGTKGGATYRFRSETAMLAWSGCP